MKDLFTRLKILFLDLYSLTLRVLKKSIRIAMSQIKGYG